MLALASFGLLFEFFYLELLLINQLFLLPPHLLALLEGVQQLLVVNFEIFKLDCQLVMLS